MQNTLKLLIKETQSQIFTVVNSFALGMRMACNEPERNYIAFPSLLLISSLCYLSQGEGGLRKKKTSTFD